MIRKIVVGLDKSALSLKALRQAIMFAQSYGAELKLVYVLSGNKVDAPQVGFYFNGYPAMHAVMMESYQSAWNEFADNSQIWLGQQVTDTKETYANVSCTLLYGDPGAKLCEFSKTWNADLILVGNRGFSGISEFWMGSVSNHVMHHAPCSVFIVHGNKQAERSSQPKVSGIQTVALQRVLVPVDRSEMSEHTISTAVDLAKLYGAEVRLVHVIDEDEHDMPQKLIFSSSQYMMQQNRLLLDEYQHDWNKFIDGWWRRLQMNVQAIEGEGIDTICDVIQGRTGPRICEVAKDWKADLIVIGSRGLSGLEELLVGSVSYYVSHRAPCSVLVVRPKQMDPESSEVMQEFCKDVLVNA